MPKKEIHNSSSLSSTVCPVINIYMYISSSSPKKRLLNKDASPLKAVCATNSAVFQLRKFRQWLRSLVFLQHQPGLQEHQNHVVSPDSSCKLEAHSRLSVWHPSHTPVALASSRLLGFRLPTNLISLCSDPFRRDLGLPSPLSVMQVKHWLSKPTLNPGKTAFDTRETQTTFQQAQPAPASGPHETVLRQAQGQDWDTATLWEISTVPWHRTPGSEAALWLFHWSCHCSSGEHHQPGHSSSSAVTKVTGLRNRNQTGAGCHCSSETFGDTTPCSCSASASNSCVQTHVLPCEKWLCVTAKNYHVSLSSQLHTLGSKRYLVKYIFNW